MSKLEMQIKERLHQVAKKLAKTSLFEKGTLFIVF